jgi:DNA polymerase-3 subunit delta
VCDGLVKGLRHPQWPTDPWEGLKRLALMVAQQAAAPASGRAGGARPQRLALQP